MIFDLSDRSQLELTGNDRVKFLHGFCTNDIKKLTPGDGCEAFVCNIQGKVLGHIFVFCTERSLWIDSVPGQEDALFNHLDRYLINEDVQIHRRSGSCRMLYWHQEPWPDEIASAAADAARRLAERPVLSHATFSAGDAAYELCKVDWLGEGDWLLSSPQLNIEGYSVAPSELWNALRIEAGFPIYGVDITADNLAQEVNRTARAISFTKGCYLGQEPIARIDALGHVNRELHRLEISSPESFGSGGLLTDPETGTQIGVLTSVAASVSTPGKVVALGYLRTKYCAVGSTVRVENGTATVVA